MPVFSVLIRPFLFQGNKSVGPSGIFFDPPASFCSCRISCSCVRQGALSHLSHWPHTFSGKNFFFYIATACARKLIESPCPRGPASLQSPVSSFSMATPGLHPVRLLLRRTLTHDCSALCDPWPPLQATKTASPHFSLGHFLSRLCAPLAPAPAHPSRFISRVTTDRRDLFCLSWSRFLRDN